MRVILKCPTTPLRMRHRSGGVGHSSVKCRCLSLMRFQHEEEKPLFKMEEEV